MPSPRSTFVAVPGIDLTIFPTIAFLTILNWQFRELASNDSKYLEVLMENGLSIVYTMREQGALQNNPTSQDRGDRG